MLSKKKPFLLAGAGLAVLFTLLLLFFWTRSSLGSGSALSYSEISFPLTSPAAIVLGRKPLTPPSLTAPIVLADDEGLRNFQSTIDYQIATLSGLLLDVSKNDSRQDQQPVKIYGIAIETLRSGVNRTINKRAADLTLFSDRLSTDAKDLSERAGDILKQKEEIDFIKEALISLSAEAKNASSSEELQEVYRKVAQKGIYTAVLPRSFSLRFLIGGNYLLGRLNALYPSLSLRVNGFSESSISAKLRETTADYQQVNELFGQQLTKLEEVLNNYSVEDVTNNPYLPASLKTSLSSTLDTLNRLKTDLTLISGFFNSAPTYRFN